jgi:hypothetical protein
MEPFELRKGFTIRDRGIKRAGVKYRLAGKE